MSQTEGGARATIRMQGLEKHFGSTHALRGVDLEVPQGTVMCLLGPNGAGKTTIVRILTTLLTPDSGWAEVAGFNVVTDAQNVRHRIGLAGQQAAVDEFLTGRMNLDMVGRLYHLPAAESRRRAGELLERFGLTDAADRLVKTYSGGMRRRLDLAASLVVSPPVLFLDEPTTGLDPSSRIDMWAAIDALVKEGATLLLTTQYLEEADRLADRIAVIDHGQVVAQGAPEELKKSIGGERVDLQVRDRSRVGLVADAVERAVGVEPDVDLRGGRLTVPVTTGVEALTAVVRACDDLDVDIEDIALRRPTLDEVFLTLTGHAADAGRELAAASRSRRSGEAS